MPSQLRDAVLAESENLVAESDQSDSNREYHAQRQLALLNNGENPWGSGPSPSELLVQVARSAVSGDRSHKRVKIPPQPGNSIAGSDATDR